MLYIFKFRFPSSLPHPLLDRQRTKSTWSSHLVWGSNPRNNWETSAHDWKGCGQRHSPHPTHTIKAPSRSPFPPLTNHFRHTQEAYSVLPQNSYFAGNKLFHSFFSVFGWHHHFWHTNQILSGFHAASAECSKEWARIRRN